MYIHTAHHFNGTGAKQIDHEPQNNALIKDDLEAAPLKKEIITDNVAEDNLGIVLYVCVYVHSRGYQYYKERNSTLQYIYSHT